MALASPHRDDLVLASRCMQRMDEIVELTMKAELAEVPELFVTDDPVLHDAVWRSTDDNMRLMIEALRMPSAIPRSLPPGPRNEADVAAQHGATPEALLRTYRLGQRMTIEFLIEEIERDGGREIKRPLEALRRATASVHTYMDAVTPLVAAEFEDERARLEHWPQLARLRAVQAVLSGDPTPDIGYALDQRHVAVAIAAARAGAIAAEVGRVLGAPALIVELDSGRCWAWFATTDAGAVREHLEFHQGAAAGIGGPRGGHEGFIASHRQAMMAFRVARRRGIVADLRSVSLEAMTLGDAAVAREVVAAELGPLAGAHERLRATIEAWFQAREHLGPAAAALGVSPRTVSYRLRRAEDLLGYRIDARRAELETALRLHRLFADS